MRSDEFKFDVLFRNLGCHIFNFIDTVSVTIKIVLRGEERRDEEGRGGEVRRLEEMRGEEIREKERRSEEGRGGEER